MQLEFIFNFKSPAIIATELANMCEYSPTWRFVVEKNHELQRLAEIKNSRQIEQAREIEILQHLLREQLSMAYEPDRVENQPCSRSGIHCQSDKNDDTDSDEDDDGIVLII